MRRNLTISLIVGIIVSAAALYFAFKNVPFGDLVNYLKAINYIWTVPAVAVALVSFAVRALRWQIILGNDAEAGINFWRAFHPMMIGFMVNCILPGRAGEIARPIILAKNDKVSFSTGLATVAAERVFDISFLIAFFAVVLTKVQIDPDMKIVYGTYQLDREILQAIAGGTLKLCLVLIIGIVLLSIGKVRVVMAGIILRIPALFFWSKPDFRAVLSERISVPLVRIVENFAAGFSLIKRPRKIIICLGLSFLVWYLSALTYYLIALGCPGIELSFWELSATMIIVCFFIALPSVPGFWGLWEAGGVFALSIFGVQASEAVGMTLVIHAASVFPVIIVGFVSAVITGVNIWRISYEKM